MTIRLSLDLNVLVADRLARLARRRGTACSMLVDAVRTATCPAGPLQFITSIPVIENWADVLRRKFGYDRVTAEEVAWVLEEYALAGPLGIGPQAVIGSRYVPFERESELRDAVRTHVREADADKLFNEIDDDRHVLLAALAGQADILATSNLRDFLRGPAIRLVRDDVILFPWGTRTLIVARPAFVAYWLQKGVAPDGDFVRRHLDDFERLANPY